MKRATMILMAVFLVIVLTIATAVNAKNTSELQRILEQSIKSELTAITLRAHDLVDPMKINEYNSVEDTEADRGAYGRTLTNLRMLGFEQNVDYIYVIKYVDGIPVFVFDTDMEDTEIFIEYDLSEVHKAAFAGEIAAGVMNVQDEFGAFNTGAAPIWLNGEVIAIICTDIADNYYQESISTARRNTILMVALLAVAMGVLFISIVRLANKVQKMQNELAFQAHHDLATGLPNRQFLHEHLAQLTQNNKKKPFALLFIDLDNFKSVNDNAGHDAGDALLLHIANFLKGEEGEGISFRPTAGKLHMAARIGGDEFIQVISGVDSEEQAAKIAEHLLKSFAAQAVDPNVERFNVGMSIGVALYPQHAQEADVLLGYADVAMYEAKHGGKNQYRVFSADMLDRVEKD